VISIITRTKIKHRKEDFGEVAKWFIEKIESYISITISRNNMHVLKPYLIFKLVCGTPIAV